MATKHNFYVKRLDKEVDGYKHNDDIGLYLDDETKLWSAVHLRSGHVLEGLDGQWKMKRQCLEFIKGVEGLNYDVSTNEELIEKNGGFDAVLAIYLAAVKKGKEA